MRFVSVSVNVLDLGVLIEYVVNVVLVFIFLVCGLLEGGIFVCLDLIMMWVVS